MVYLTLFAVATDIYAFMDPRGKIHYVKREMKPGQENKPSTQFHWYFLSVEQQFKLFDLLTVSERFDFLMKEVEWHFKATL